MPRGQKRNYFVVLYYNSKLETWEQYTLHTVAIEISNDFRNLFSLIPKQIYKLKL